MHACLPRRLWLAIALSLLSACGRADVSESRRSFIAAHDHATLSIAIAVPATSAGNGRCSLALRLNGEPFLNEPLFAAPGASTLRSGFQFMAPAGPAQASATLDCGAPVSLATLSLTLAKDTLTALHFDGKALTADAAQPYRPATLDALQGGVERLNQQGDEHADAQLASLERLTRWQMGATAGAAALALACLWRRRRKARPA